MANLSIPSQYSAPIRLLTRLQGLFPPGVVVVETREPGDESQLLPAEAVSVRRAVPKRVKEFAAGRVCARTALGAFGVGDFALCAADDRQPVWPAGFVGSITHTTGLCAAAVASRRAILAIGMDSEIAGAPTRDIWSSICRPEEFDWINGLPPIDQPLAVTLLFSAKEAFYKCQYPLVGQWLDFHDLRVQPTWGEFAGTFAVHAIKNIQFARHTALPLTGRYAFHEQFVLTGVSVPATQ